MTYMKIVFSSIAPIEEEQKCIDLLLDYLSCLYKNGQIFLNFELVRLPGANNAFTTIPEVDSLDKKYNNIYVNECYEKIKTIFNISYETIGISLDHGEPCRCSNPSWYMLYTNSSDSPIICGDCGQFIPLYKIPHHFFRRRAL